MNGITNAGRVAYASGDSYVDTYGNNVSYAMSRVRAELVAGPNYKQPYLGSYVDQIDFANSEDENGDIVWNAGISNGWLTTDIRLKYVDSISGAISYSVESITSAIDIIRSVFGHTTYTHPPQTSDVFSAEMMMKYAPAIPRMLNDSSDAITIDGNPVYISEYPAAAAENGLSCEASIFLHPNTYGWSYNWPYTIVGRLCKIEDGSITDYYTDVEDKISIEIDSDEDQERWYACGVFPFVPESGCHVGLEITFVGEHPLPLSDVDISTCVRTA